MSRFSRFAVLASIDGSVVQACEVQAFGVQAFGVQAFGVQAFGVQTCEVQAFEVHYTLTTRRCRPRHECQKICQPNIRLQGSFYSIRPKMGRLASNAASRAKVFGSASHKWPSYFKWLFQVAISSDRADD